jgi:hypothetical protein
MGWATQRPRLASIQKYLWHDLTCYEEKCMLEGAVAIVTLPKNSFGCIGEQRVLLFVDATPSI